MTIEVPYQPLPIHQSDVRYAHGPDSAAQPGVPSGETIEFDWNDSAIYPGTSRKFWVHVPASYNPAKPASILVFQDGWWYLDPDGEVRGATVLDNLVHRGDIPVTIGVFVDPGVFPDAENPKNRNTEYDAFDDRYVSFLLNEIIPEVTKHYSIAEDPDQWGICGGSSGGNCAFTAAWLRPDKFRRVTAFLSSFTQMPGATPTPNSFPASPASRCVSSSKRAIVTCAGTSPRGTGSPTTCASRPRSRKQATTSAWYWATAVTAPTTAASCSPMPSAGCGDLTRAECSQVSINNPEYQGGQLRHSMAD